MMTKQFKRSVITLLAIVFSSITTVAAPSWYGDAGWWDSQPDGLLVRNHVLVGVKGTCPESVILPDDVTSIGSFAFKGCTALKVVVLPDSVTRIGSSAFEECVNLTSIAIPDSVTRIGSSAFEECVNLTSIAIPDSVTQIGSSAFEECVNLTSIAIPGGVTSIGDRTFKSCTALNSIEFSGNVMNIGDFAFEKCVNLTSVTISVNVTRIGNGAFEGTGFWNNQPSGIVIHNGWVLGVKNYCPSIVVLPFGVKGIADCAFENCSDMRNVSIPDSVTNIGRSAFEGTAFWYYQPYGIVIHDGWVLGVIGYCPMNATLPSGVKGIADFAFANCNNLRRVTISPGVTTIGNFSFSGCHALWDVSIPHGVISIGTSAFDSCCELENVVIPNSVTSISDWTFRGCTALRLVELSENMEYVGRFAFEECVNLRYIAIPDNVTKIDDWAFSGCTALSWVGLSDNIEHIGRFAFEECVNLTSIYIPDNVTKIDDWAFSGCTALSWVGLPDNIEHIGRFAFEECVNLTSIYIPDNVTKIDDWAFSGCTALSLVGLSDNIEHIGRFAFEECVNLTSIAIPGNVTSIGDWTFRGCTALKSVEIPDSMMRIGKFAFEECFNLKSVAIPDSVTSIGADAFTGTAFWNSQSDGVVTHDGWVLGVKGDCPANVVLPSDVKGIADSVFENRADLTSIAMPDSMTRIGDWAFRGCAALKDVALSDNMTRIGDFAFEECINLTSVMIPDSMTRIGDWTFRGCTALKNVILSDNMTRIGDFAFEECINLTSVMIPDSMTSVGNDAFAGTAFWNSQSDGVVTHDGWVLGVKGDCPANVVLPSGVKGIANSAFGCCTSLAGVTIPDSVTHIGGNVFAGTAFWDNQPDGIVMHDGWVLGVKGDCPANVVLPSGVKGIAGCAFFGCTGLTDLTIPDSMICIGENAFLNCSKEMRMTVPNRINMTEESGVAGCENQLNVNLKGDSWKLTGTNPVEFKGCYIGGESSMGLSVSGPGILTFQCKTTGDGVRAVFRDHYHDSVICDVQKSKGILSIVPSQHYFTDKYCGYYETDYDYDLTGDNDWETWFVYCPATYNKCMVEWICRGTSDEDSHVSVRNPVWHPMTNEETKFSFQFSNDELSIWCDNCIYLPRLVIPSQLAGMPVTSVGCGLYSRDYFSDSVLKDLIVQDGVRNVIDYSFRCHTNLTTVALPNSITNIGVAAFEECKSLKNTRLPSELKRIGACAFAGCEKLRTVTAPEGITDIGDMAFCESGLTAFNIPASVLCVGDGAFMACENLREVSVDGGEWLEISPWAFAWCDKLEKVYFTGGVPVCDETVFYGVSDAVGYYPSAYAAEWEAVIENGTWNGLRMKKVADTTPGESGPMLMTVEISATAARRVKLNGATLKIMNGGFDITSFLNIPAVDEEGCIDLGELRVRSEIAQEVLDAKTGAEFKMVDGKPVLTTAPTRPGLIYTLREGETIDAMRTGDSTFGNGRSWRPNITVRGGTSGFYSIWVNIGQ